MAPSARVKAAFLAMENIGIPKQKTKPALKKLSKLFDKNWDLIEAENYRVLADAIFEYEDTETAEKEKKIPDNTNQEDVLEEADPMQDLSERPLKRLRLKHQDQAVQSDGQANPSSGAFVLKIPKSEPGEPEVSFNQSVQPTSASPQSNVGNKRTESQPISPQPLVKDKGKKPISPTAHVASRDKRPVVQRASQTLQIKEPKPGPGVILTGKKSQSHTDTLIKPKDEPFTDDMMSFEALAVVPPEFSSQKPLAEFSNQVDSQDDKERGTFKSVNGIDKCLETVALLTTKENHLKESDVSGTAASKIEIAASPLGEVKMYLSYNHAPKGHDFHVPDVQAVVKEVEDNCIKTYKVLNTEFSVTKLMRGICECALELGRNGQGMMQGKPNTQEAASASDEATCRLPSSLNGSMNAESSDIVAAPAENAVNKVSDPPSVSYCQQVCLQSDKNDSDNHCAERDSSTVAGMNAKSLVTEAQPLNADDMSCLYDVSDITRGKEEVKVFLEKSNSESLPSFLYISRNVISHNAGVVFSLAQIEDKDCCFSCNGDCSLRSPSCNCVQRNGGQSPYTSDGLVREDFLEDCISIVRNPQSHYLTYCKECPLEKSKNEDMLDPCKGHLKRKFIKECWTKCGCNKHCGNRVVQQGIRCKLQVFWTPEGKGWGLRTLEEIPKGAFVCEYVGEILTNMEHHKRNLRTSNDKHSYSVLLDTDWGSRDLKEDELLCLDASRYGNVARFMNHRCSDANLIQIPVEVEIPKHHYYHIALFTTRKIDAFEELTWDYGVDFDDNEHQVKEFRCLCGSKFCRNMKRSSRSRSSLILS